MTECNDLLQKMPVEVVSAVEKYGAALEMPPDEFAELLIGCPLEEKQAIAQWLNVLNRHKGVAEKGTLIDSVINILICRHPDKDEFYRLLHESLNEICAQMKERRDEFSLLAICNIKIPYEGDGLVCLTDNRYIELTHLVQEQFDKLIRIYDTNYPQKTQTSSAVLRVLDAIEDEELRAVLFSLWNNLLTSGGQARELAPQ